jgi:glutaredoxin
MDAVLYTRRGCHLCDEMDRQLQRHGITAQKVDIDDDPELQEKYGMVIPVVSINGRERFRGRISDILLKRLIENT